ncbi:MAG: adenosine kinase, partial [Mesorhizobium sp.]
MPEYDVLCIGNAIVDIIAQCDDAFLETNGIIKGAMNLID